MTFTSLGLSASILKGIDAVGYTTPTEIQSKAIPRIMEGGDIIGCSKTGSGKTAAFVLPILHRLMENHQDRAPRYVRALILTPTRELALQVEEAVRTYGAHTRLRSVTLFGGVDIGKQLQKLRHSVDIVVATPGRLLDIMQRRSIDLSHVEALVLDEADRMFDMGFIQEVKRIISHVPPTRQTLLFSATMSSEVEQLTRSIQKHPKRIDVGERHNPVETVAHRIFPIHHELKLDLLFHILEQEEMESVLIFSRTKHGADKIVKKLERKGVRAVAFHSDRSQNQRQRALSGFKQGQFKVLVATDIAARGIDVDGISHVINYDTPTYAEDYIHRIGRTGRAGASGDAFTFVSSNEEQHLRKIERFIGKRFEKSRYPGFDYKQAASAEPVKTFAKKKIFKRGDRSAPFERTERNSSRRESRARY